ncbi:MAG: response regulator [Xanthomonadales bacterium]|nr:response regulator [Xanthomonadales bacterium]
MVGLDVLKTIAEQTKSPILPTIILTGFGDEATAVHALQGGAQGYLPKRDLNGEELGQAINCAIKAHKRQMLVEKSRLEMVAKNQELTGKYQQVEAFNQQILGKFKKPVLALRDHIAELTVEETRPMNGNLQSHLLNLKLQSERLVTTLKDLMDNPGLEVGQLLIATRPEAIVELLSATVNNFRTLAEARNIRFSVKIQPGLPEVQMARYRIELSAGKSAGQRNHVHPTARKRMLNCGAAHGAPG